MRRVLAFCLLLLLLSMQHEAQVHAFTHYVPHSAQSGDTGLASADADADAGCGTCALLAAGANAVADTSAAPLLLAGADDPPRSAYRSRATPAPIHFSSRAPPAFS